MSDIGSSKKKKLPFERTCSFKNNYVNIIEATGLPKKGDEVSPGKDTL